MATTIVSEMSGSVWKVLCKEGDQVTEDQELVIIESMKMEIPIMATQDGMVERVLVAEGGLVSAGDDVVVLK